MADNAPPPPETPLEPPQEVSDALDDATSNPFSETPDGAPVASGGLTDKLHSVPSYVWIGLAIAAGTLVVGILAYRRNNGAAAYQSGYNAAGIPAADATTGMGLDSSTQALFDTTLQNQQTTNSLLQQLLTTLRAPITSTVASSTPTIKKAANPGPMRPPPLLSAGVTYPTIPSGSAVASTYSHASAPSPSPTVPGLGLVRHGPTQGSPVRAPSPPLHNGGHWAV